MCDEKNGHRMLCPFFFIWGKVKYAILEERELYREMERFK
ncbi:hypothetical protein BTF1_01520 [Bacillus thuringiensis HD-789]|uniref:Uncharacterized protein n=2 Tax=Bacillus thuringiensis TaxID=1428 RepID=A0A9W3JAM0_BACTU|nr:hypothetical protein BTG_17330 [Bacillus thuringiensis HD-771]AFQ24529.1 hypothetical protein BTF1_01520 [Bacillus thuringiensis HD-789]